MTFGVFTEHNAILIGVLLFGIALWIYFSNRHRPRNVMLGALLAMGGYWSFAHILWRVAETPEQAAPYFATLAQLAAEGRRVGLPLVELSMGMSADYEVAIAHGATWVRVGSALFGGR